MRISHTETAIVARAARADGVAFWERRDCPGMLARLIEVTE